MQKRETKAASARRLKRRGRLAAIISPEDTPDTSGEPAKGRKPQKLSRTRRPDGMSLEEWQRALRQDFGKSQSFELANVGERKVFSEFRVTNPASGNTYRVSIRGRNPGSNYCSCPDFATNALGTCKHIEFTLAKLEADGATKALSGGWKPAFSEVFVQYGMRREVRFQAGTECSAELTKLAGKFFDKEGRLPAERFGDFDRFLSDAGKLEDELRCYDDTLALVAEVRDAAHRREVIAKAFPRGVKSAALREIVNAELYDYQKEGALFAATAGRCLIGDEMGLGKTVQAITAAEILARHASVERVLIVCPTSLKYQWEREIERFTGRPTEVISGLYPARQAGYQTPTFFKITNYDVVQRDLDLIDEWSPDLVILDEAQRIKNWNTRTAKVVKKIAAPLAIVLTGTPLENRLEDLVSLMEFVDQHRLGPIYKLLSEHQIVDEAGRTIGYQRLDQLGQSLQPVLIRRRKAEVLSQLPPRMVKEFFVPMTPQQKEMHEENAAVVGRVVKKWRQFGFLSESDQRRLMISLQKMRMSCDSTWLLDQETDHGTKADEVIALLSDLLETPGTKVVLFSQWLRMHEVLVKRLKKRDWGYVLFHGGIESSKRRHLVDSFREDPDCRLFLSTDAGGVGLNLQHAHVVINLDLPWNPAVLEQRIGRVHRMGQSQPVQVYNFVAQGTIEHSMIDVLKFKKSLFAGILDGGDKEVFLGGSRLKRFLETVEQVTSHIPAPAQDEEQAESNGELSAAKNHGQNGAATSSPLPTNLKPSPSGGGFDGQMVQALLTQGTSLLQNLASALTKPADSDAAEATAKATATPVRVERDASTGRSSLRIDLPEPQVMQQALSALAQLLAGQK